VKFSTVVWQNSAQLFGEIQHSCLAKFSSFRVGETERQFFIAESCVLATFCLAQKFW